MTPERWSAVKRIVHAALSHTPPERAAIIATACAGDAAIQREVESLLALEAGAAGFMSTPASDRGMLDSAASFVGRQAGSYAIQAQIGAGGMGEVYRGRDARLGRDVAIKILPRLFTTDPDRLARFEREARLLASLNHPHIGAIYGLEEVDGIPALILELVEGDTLADVIDIVQTPDARRLTSRTTGLPIAQSLEIARQIADALEAAHEKGIVHRDLKPANIKITPDGIVKVLDFGLAKLSAGGSGGIEGAATESTNSPTITKDDTGHGIVLGTAAYMSPEQARGKPVDKRTDMWAFGCVLFEMLTGRTPFAGDTTSDTIVAILEREPDWSLLPAGLPAPIRRLLRRCFEKDRKRRLDSAPAARLEIDDALGAQPGEIGAAAAPARRIAPMTVGALVVGAVLSAVVMWAVVRPAPQAPVLSSRFAIVTPPGQPLNVSGFARDLALSPDGRHLVYRVGGTNSAGSPLMVRATDKLDAQPLADITFAYAPFFAPDNQWIGYFENGELKKISIRGGPPVTIGPVKGAALGASWGDDNTIVFATDDPGTGLWQVSADGGQPRLLTKPDTAQREGDHRFPSVLPGGHAVLFAIASTSQTDNSQVAVVELASGHRKTLVSGSQAEYVDVSRGPGQARSTGSAREGGYLIYATGGTLHAVPFDPVRLEVRGEPVTVVEHVMMKPTGAANYAVSRLGTLVYMPPGPSAQTTPRSLVWVDRKGHEESLKAPLRAYGNPRVSPDGTRVATEIYDQNSDIWIWDFATETMRRLTFDPGGDGLTVWTHDGRHIIFQSRRTGMSNVFIQAADGTGTVDRLTSAIAQWPTSITADGTHVVGFDLVPGTPSHVIFLPLPRPVRRPGFAPSREVTTSPIEALATTRFKGGNADVSPNGRYIAYQSPESGRSEVYVRPFPRVESGRWQVSIAGGTRPLWARSGRELFYLDGANTLTTVPVRTSGPTFSAGSPAVIFDTKYVESNPSRHYDVSADGQRFLMIKDTATGDPNATPASMVVVLNWFEELKAKVPAGK